MPRRRDPHDDPPPYRAPRSRSAGPPPTIAECRRSHISAFTVHCLGPLCWHQAHFTFDGLGLADDVVFVEIPRHRRFRCVRCGGRRVSVFPDWSDLPRPGHGYFGRG